jgi:hypothetical protein
MQWLHHLPEGVNLSTKLSDEALELWRCTWVRQVTLGGMTSIHFSDVLHGRLLGDVSACSALARMSGVGTGFPAYLAAPIQAVTASCTWRTASSIELPTALHPANYGTIATKQLSSAKPTSYGFLSGSAEALKLAAAAKQVQIDLKDGRILDARVLQVNPIGSP